MPIRTATLLLLALALAGCGTISERGGRRVDALCSGPFEDMGTCHSAAERYCGDRAVKVLHDYSQDLPPQKRLLFSCK